MNCILWWNSSAFHFQVTSLTHNRRFFHAALTSELFIGTLFTLWCSWNKYPPALGVVLSHVLVRTVIWFSHSGALAAVIWWITTCWKSHSVLPELHIQCNVCVCFACGTHSKYLNTLLSLSLIFWHMGILPCVYHHYLPFVCVCCSLQYVLISLLACWSLQFVLYDYYRYTGILLVSPCLYEKVFMPFECRFSWFEWYRYFWKLLHQLMVLSDSDVNFFRSSIWVSLTLLVMHLITINDTLRAVILFCRTSDILSCICYLRL